MTQERARLVAERFRALLDQARASRWSRRDDRLNLAAPLPEVKRWPPLFSGEPTSPEDADIMRTPLRWDDVNKLAAWARTFACYAMGMQWQTPSAVRAQARGRLHRSLDAAVEGLDIGETQDPGPSSFPADVPVIHRRSCLTVRRRSATLEHAATTFRSRRTWLVEEENHDS